MTILKLKKSILPIILLFVLTYCGSGDNITAPELTFYQKWVEVEKVNLDGMIDESGAYTVRNVFELFDSTYHYTSSTINPDSTSDPFYYYLEGRYAFGFGGLDLYTPDKERSNIFAKTESNDTLRIHAIGNCWRSDNSAAYFCRLMRDTNMHMQSFIWDNFKNKTSAVFIKSN